MKILHVVRSELSVRKFLIPFIKAQEQQGNKIFVACGRGDDLTKCLRNNINVVEYDLKRKLNIANIYGAIKSLRKIILQEQIDLIITHMPLASAVVRLTAKFFFPKTKVIYVAHGLPCAPHQNKVKWCMWFIAEWILGKFTDAIFLMNNYDFNLSVKTRILFNRNMIRRIPGMGVNLVKFSSGKPGEKSKICQRLGIKEPVKIILFVARMIKEKGVFDLLEAAALLRNRGCVFIFIGSGPLDARIKDFIKKERLEDIVFFLGWREDVHEFMRGCDIFTLPTYYFEGLPVTILEAMACAKPVVSTKHRGPEDVVIEGQTGFLVDVKNPKEVANAIQKLCNSSTISKSMGQLGRQLIQQYYSIEECVKCFLNELEAVLSKLDNLDLTKTGIRKQSEV